MGEYMENLAQDQIEGGLIAEAERLEELRLKYTTRDPKDHLMRCVAVCPELEGRAARCEVPQSKLKNDSFTCPCGNVPILTDIED